MIFGAIVAGGVGNRMNISKIPKQFLPLGKSKNPIIIHTLEKFLTCDDLDYIYIGVHKDWIDYTEELLIKYNLNKEKIILVEGGKDRNLTILNIINEIENKHGENENNIIVTHDAVRPFVTLKMIKENILQAVKFGACNTVIPSVDTIVESLNGKTVSAIPNREFMFLGQTPQSFNITKLKNLYNDLSEEEKNILTDACKILVFRNQPVSIVEGDSFNIKITTQSDYKIANALLGGDIID